MKNVQVYIEGIELNIGNYIALCEFLSYEEPRKPWNIFPHTHESFEMHFVGAGKGRLVTDYGEYELSDGMMFITGPGVVHSQFSEVEDSMDEFSITVGFTKCENSSENDATTDEMIEYLINNPFYIDKADIGCRELIHSMMNEVVEQLPGWKDKTKAVFGDLLLRVLRHMSGVREAQESLDHSYGTKIGGINYKMWIDRHLLIYHRPVSEEYLAERLSISRRHLGRLMQKYYGMTYSEKINSLRVDTAKRLLWSTELPIAAISQQVGFTTVQYFIRVFNKFVGMPPGVYRKKMARKNTLPPAPESEK